jgi:hypothetical protein
MDAGSPTVRHSGNAHPTASGSYAAKIVTLMDVTFSASVFSHVSGVYIKKTQFLSFSGISQFFVPGASRAAPHSEHRLLMPCAAS